MFRAFKAGNAIQFEPKAFRLLLFLIENRGRLIEKDEILEVVWNGTHVTGNSLASEIAKLRKALGDDSKTPKYIQTVRTRGYRFIAEVREQNGSEQTPTPTSLSGSSEFDSAPRSNNQEHASSNAVVFQRQASTKAWGMRLAVMGLIVTLVVAALISLKIYQGQGRRRPRYRSLFVRSLPGPGMDFNPSFSPDEESIAYSSDHNGSFDRQAVDAQHKAERLFPVSGLVAKGEPNCQRAFGKQGQHLRNGD